MRVTPRTQRILKPLLLFAAAIFATPMAPCNAQRPDRGDVSNLKFEEDDGDLVEEAEGLREERDELIEHLEELQVEIREARDEGELKWVRHLEGRQDHVRKLIELMDDVLKLQRMLIRAEENEESERAEEIEEKLSLASFALDRVQHLGELEGTLQELQIARQELTVDRELDLRDRIDSLIEQQKALLKIVRRFYEAIADEEDDIVDRLERQIDRTAEPVELRIEEFFLERELQWAREENAPREIRELTAELREVRDALQEFQNEQREREEKVESQRVYRPMTSRSVRSVGVDTSQIDFASLSFDRDVVAVLQRFCFDCHGTATQEADLNIAAKLKASPLIQHRDLWKSVVQHVRTGVMPPAENHQPSVLQRTKLLAWLEHTLENFDYDSIRQPGFEPARRLSHHEYNRTVRDLFGMDLRPADAFPADSSGDSGFDNSANTLFLQPLLVERYFGAAEEILDAAIPGASIDSPTAKECFGNLIGAANGQKDVETSFRRFLLRAYRRPPTATEVGRLGDQYRTLCDRGMSPAAAIRTTLGAVLVSPDFLMRIESPAKDESDHRVTSWDLASRLSYFLWASMPDDRLFQLAESGALRQPEAVRSEVDRMLQDPRAESLGTVFAAQWLGFQHLGSRVRLDPIDNPWCTDTLMDAMRAESSLFFVSLLQEDQTLDRMINADFTYLNEELARHYRIAGVQGSEMQRVRLTTTRRGGIFGQGSLLAVTSFPDRTSPVVRGKWILSEVLGTPPPPPPPNVSEFDEQIEDNERLTLRRKLELHRRKPACASCHDQIDPLGLSLENYDNFGRWRTRTEGGRVDATGQLPDGTQFSGLSGLQKVILERRLGDFARQITRKMLAYALGRQLEYFDESAVRTIVTQFREDDYRLRTLVHSIVNSYPFQYRRMPTSAEAQHTGVSQ